MKPVFTRPSPGNPAPARGVPPQPPRPPASSVSTVSSPVQDSRTASQKTISDFSVVLGVPPVTIGQDYLDTCRRVAALLGLTVGAAASELSAVDPTQSPSAAAQRTLAVAPGSVSPWGPVGSPRPASTPVPSADDGSVVKNLALSARNAIFGFIDRVNAFTSQASDAGLVPPDNPFVVIAGLSASRDLVLRRSSGQAPSPVDPTEADALVFNIGAYVDLLAAQAVGRVNLDARQALSAQLNGFTVSLDGFGSGGNTAVDLMRFLPSADEVRSQADLNLLSAFDFKKRVPTVLFTADYVPAGDLVGTLVGWKRIPDASGYIVKRRNIFDGTERTFQLANADLSSGMAYLVDYLETYVFSFYDTVSSDQSWVFLDKTVSPHQYYLYTVQAYQVHNDGKDQIFTVVTNPSSLSATNRNRLVATLAGLARQYFGQEADEDSINPWPMVSLIIYGNSQFDWILSAVNSRASVNRNDPTSDTRRFSYLGARASHILEFMDQGRFVVPRDVNDVVRNVDSSVTNFGVSQTVAEILYETGILYYFEGTEQKTPSGFNRAGTLNVGASPLLSGIISIVDSETATLDLSSLGSNLPQILTNTQYSNDPGEVTGLSLSLATPQPNVHAGTQEINVPTDQSGSVSQADVQYVGSLPPTGDSIIDLTTFDGLRSLVRTIRLFADEGPNRGGGDATTPTVMQPPSPVAVLAPASPPQTVYNPLPSPPAVAGIRVSPPPVNSLPTLVNVSQDAPAALRGKLAQLGARGRTGR